MSKQLEFKDLSPFDLNLLKDMAVRKVAETAQHSGSDALIETVFEMIRAKGFDIVQSDRPATWSELNKSHYIPAPIHKNWWKS